MNVCVIHDNYGILARKRLHVVEKAVDEITEEGRGKRALHNFDMNHTVEGHCREEGVPKRSWAMCCTCCNEDLPTAAHKKCLANSTPSR